MKKIFTSLLLIAGFIFTTYAQIPTGIKLKNNNIPQPVQRFSSFNHDVLQLMNDDEKNMKTGSPLRFAIGEEEIIDLSGIEFQYTYQGKNVWRYNITTNYAQGMILTFTKFQIPMGDSLYIYSSDGKFITGYDAFSNARQKAFASKYIESDNIIIEYISEANQTAKPAIVISNIAKGYRAKEELGCYINTSCSEGDNWQRQKNGIVGLVINEQGSWYICSGSLVNNARQDKTPYILTANHCISSADETTFQTMTFEFFKESTSMDCSDISITSSLTKSLMGSSLVARNSLTDGSDGALLKIIDSIPDDWKVYYNGFDARGIAADSGVTIHHPAGMVKKISTYKNQLTNISHLNTGDQISADSSHWMVNWSQTENGFSVTYGGSSGSPLFNQDGLIVGTLTGGNSYCDAPDSPDFYGKFSMHWKGSADTNAFSQFLDPDHTGVLVINGYDPHAYIFNSAPVANTASNITPFSFDANWEKLNDTIETYLLSVYQTNDSGVVTYLPGFYKKNTGKVQSYSLTNLNFNSKYYYRVQAVVGYSVSAPSNEVTVTTPDATFEYHVPVATNASDILTTGFTANWLQMDDAVSYRIDVFSNNEAITKTDSVDFAGNVIPDNWQSNSSTFIKTSNQFGIAAPSLRLDTDENILSPAIDSMGIIVKNLSFWYRGMLTDIFSKIIIEYPNNEEWTTLKTFTSIVSKSPGAHLSIDIDSTLAIKQIRVRFETTTGYLVVDDIVLTTGNIATSEILFQNIDAGNSLNYAVTGLMPFTNYSYQVQGNNGSVYSYKSNLVKVKTLYKDDKIQGHNAHYRAWFAKNRIIIQSDLNFNTGSITLYAMNGLVIIKKTMNSNYMIIPVENLQRGVYLLKTDSEVHKIVID